MALHSHLRDTTALSKTWELSVRHRFQTFSGAAYLAPLYKTHFAADLRGNIHQTEFSPLMFP